MEGWIKLHRQIMENPLYFSEQFTRLQAWIDMLLLANTKDGFFFKRGIRVDVIRGQVGYDVDSLAKRWKWSRGKVERFLIMLEMDRQIIRQKSNITTLISICNYNSDQSGGNANSNANNNANSNSNEHQTIMQTDTNKNNKNKKNDKEEDLFNSESFSFDEFWNMYKKRVDTSKCRQKFDKLTSQDKAKIKDTLPTYLELIKDKTYLKNPLNYLIGKCWIDELLVSNNKPIEKKDKTFYEIEIEKYAYSPNQLLIHGAELIYNACIAGDIPLRQ